MSTKKERMYERIKNHGKDIQDYFGLKGDPVKLCKQLRRLELKSNRVMVQYCNGEIDSDETEKYVLEYLKPRLEKIFGNIAPIYINHDPRGHTLKLNSIESERVKGYKDWGGYFILAPDFSE